jgi:hypothetical protein
VLCNAITNLPPRSLVATHLSIAGDVQFLCGRGVLVQLDDLFPYRRGYFEKARARAQSAMAAMYSSRWEDMAALGTFGVTHVLIYRPPSTGKGDLWSVAYPFLAPPDSSKAAHLAPPPGTTKYEDQRFLLLAL